MIHDEGIAVVTPQGAETSQERHEVEALVKNLRSAPVPDLAKVRLLQPYTTNVHTSALQKAGVNALMTPILGTEVRRGALVEWRGDYDQHTGITIDPKVEDFVL